MAGVLETINLNEKSKRDLKESMKRFARGNRFPAEERAIYHKSLARDSPFPRLKGGVTPDHLFGKGECRLSLDLAKRKSICPCAFQRRRKKRKRRNFGFLIFRSEKLATI